MSTITFKPFVPDNDVLGDDEALRARIADQGFLFIKGLGPKDQIRQARTDVMQLLKSEGWIKDGTDPYDGIANPAVEPCAEGDPQYMAVYKKVLGLKSFDSLPAAEEYMKIAERIMGCEVYNHRRRIGRITFPGFMASTTGPHQDFFYIRGTPTTYTMWQPIGACPVGVGPVAVLKNSHREGYIEHKTGVGTKYAGGGVTENQWPSGAGVEWVCGDYELGDVLIFHSHTIHRALPNVSGDRFRLSTDNRYQPMDSERGPGADRTHHNL